MSNLIAFLDGGFGVYGALRPNCYVYAIAMLNFVESFNFS